MLIDCSYFTRAPRQIQNASLGTLPNPNAVEVNRAIEAYIAYWQESFLSKMLGEAVANKVNAYLVCHDEDETAPVVESFETVCKELKESFADYVFFKILGDSNTESRLTGLVVLKSADYVVSPYRRMVDVWNRMAERNRIFSRWVAASSPIAGISVSEDMLAKLNPLGI